MDWNAEDVFNRREELQHFLHENNVNTCWIQETPKNKVVFVLPIVYGFSSLV
jgi:hypothetical protein